MPYTLQSEDSSREVEDFLIERYRSMESWQKIMILRRLSQRSVTLALSGLRERFPEASDAELRLLLLELRAGPDLAQQVRAQLQREA